MTKSILTITNDEAGNLDIRIEFEPAAVTAGPMTPDQAAAMAAIAAIKDWAGEAGASSDESE